jgi:hypothetical protein
MPQFLPQVMIGKDLGVGVGGQGSDQEIRISSFFQAKHSWPDERKSHGVVQI